MNVTETTQTQMKPPGGAKPRSPEFRLAADALRGLRQDLFHDAFAYRPLPRMGWTVRSPDASPSASGSTRPGLRTP